MAASHIVVLGVQFLVPPPNFRFLLVQTLGGSGGGSSDCVLATHIGNLDGFPGFSIPLKTLGAVVVTQVGRLLPHMGDLFEFLAYHFNSGVP